MIKCCCSFQALLIIGAVGHIAEAVHGLMGFFSLTQRRHVAIAIMVMVAFAANSEEDEVSALVEGSQEKARRSSLTALLCGRRPARLGTRFSDQESPWVSRV